MPKIPGQAPRVNGSIKWLLDGKTDYIRKKYIIIIKVKKFEGHKPGQEKRLEHDQTIFRDRLLFLIAVDKF